MTRNSRDSYKYSSDDGKMEKKHTEWQKTYAYYVKLTLKIACLHKPIFCFVLIDDLSRI